MHLPWKTDDEVALAHRVWQDQLRSLDDEALAKATRDHAGDSVYFPKPAELRKLAFKHQPPASRPRIVEDDGPWVELWKSDVDAAQSVFNRAWSERNPRGPVNMSAVELGHVVDICDRIVQQGAA